MKVIGKTEDGYEERIDYMLSEMGEGWEDAERFSPVVRSGWVVVFESSTDRFAAVFEDPSGPYIRKDICPRMTRDTPRAAVDALLMSARRRHEEHAEILKAAEAARGWAE